MRLLRALHSLQSLWQQKTKQVDLESASRSVKLLEGPS